MNESGEKSYLLAFGLHLKRIRTDKGLSYRKMAQLCKLDYAHIQRIEQGEKNITLLTLLAMSEALQVTPKDMLDFNN